MVFSRYNAFRFAQMFQNKCFILTHHHSNIKTDSNFQRTWYHAIFFFLKKIVTRENKNQDQFHLTIKYHFFSEGSKGDDPLTK